MALRPISGRRSAAIRFWRDFACCEPILLFLASLLISSAHLFLSGAPNLTIIFDSQGFLGLVAACNQVFTANLLSKVMHYLASGCPEAMRAELALSLLPALDLLKSGPTLPAILGPVYAIVGKAVTQANWEIAAWTMITVQALVPPLLWLTGQEIGGRAVARVAGLIAITYAPFTINASRILLELPACLFLSILVYMALRLSVERKNGQDGILCNIVLLLEGFAFGAAGAALTISKSTLLVLPLLLAVEAACIIWLACRRFSISWLSGVLIGSFVVLAPWMIATQILTGKPTILVKRHGAYNLWAGSNLASDGWDAVPCRYVNHPEEFPLKPRAVLENIASQARQHPFEFASLSLRKPARIISSPWNDFQNSCFGQSCRLQLWWHELLLLFASIGFFACLSRFSVTRERAWLTAAVIAVTAILYHLAIYSPFISMSRYFFPAMPAVVILAALGLCWLVERMRGRHSRDYLTLAWTTFI